MVEDDGDYDLLAAFLRRDMGGRTSLGVEMHVGRPCRGARASVAVFRPNSVVEAVGKMAAHRRILDRAGVVLESLLQRRLGFWRLWQAAASLHPPQHLRQRHRFRDRFAHGLASVAFDQAVRVFTGRKRGKAKPVARL